MDWRLCKTALELYHAMLPTCRRFVNVGSMLQLPCLVKSWRTVGASVILSMDRLIVVLCGFDVVGVSCPLCRWILCKV